MSTFGMHLSEKINWFAQIITFRMLICITLFNIFNYSQFKVSILVNDVSMHVLMCVAFLSNLLHNVMHRTALVTIMISNFMTKCDIIISLH